MNSKKIIRVAVGVVENTDGEILIAKRPAHLHQGDLWEFPGGKIEENETCFDALVREFQEEVNIRIQSGQPLMEVTHDYGDKQVNLEVMTSQDFSGEAEGLEGQEVKWVTKVDLKNYTFPEANTAILEKII